MDGARAGQALPEAQESDEVGVQKLKKLHEQYLANHPKTEPRWYGAPAAAADVIELALLSHLVASGHGFISTRTDLEVVAISYLVSGPVVHAVHGHFGRAGGSFALRAGALLVASLGAAAAFANAVGSEGHPSGAAPFGTLLVPLPLVAMGIDDAGLAWDEVPAAAPAQAAWTPALRIQSGLALLGIRGSF
jgi:hypothetical protein